MAREKEVHVYSLKHPKTQVRGVDWYQMRHCRSHSVDTFSKTRSKTPSTKIFWSQSRKINIESMH